MAKKKKEKKEYSEMSFLDHLEELRWHLIRSTLAIIIFAFLAFLLKDFIFSTIIFAPIDAHFITYQLFCEISTYFGSSTMCFETMPFKLQSLAMGEQFNVHVWTSITAGFIISFPYIIYELWQFISPGLYEKERKNALKFIIVSSFLFFIGVLFGYYVITPLSVNFLGNYSISNAVERNFQISSYIALIRSAVLVSGLIFELPIIIYFLTKLGLVTPSFLRQYRKHAIIVVLLLAAIVTPPDVVSQVIVSIPILILYEISIFISSIVYKREQKLTEDA